MTRTGKPLDIPGDGYAGEETTIAISDPVELHFSSWPILNRPSVAAGADRDGRLKTGHGVTK
jgi:hypothetical protein